MRKVWIEAALSGAWSRALQPGIPATIESIVAEGVAKKAVRIALNLE